MAVLARAQQDAVWDRIQVGNKLTSHLREYFPGFLAAVGVRREGPYHPIARVLLATAPTPKRAARLTVAQLRSLLRKAGRKNTIDAEIITRFPGLGPLSGARVLAEIGDDRSRFTNATGLKAYAGAAPVTRASGKNTTVLARRSRARGWLRWDTCGPSLP